MKAGDNWVFIHVPKTAGNSIQEALPGRKEPFGLEANGLGNHTPCRLVSGDKFRFGFTRNPWQRLVSLAIWSYIPKELFRKSVEEENFHWNRPTFGAYLGIRDSMWFLEGCDFIGKVENLQRDFDEVCGIIGVEKKKLNVLNSCPEYDYREWYTDDLIEIVAEKHKDTIERFGYEFETKGNGEEERPSGAFQVSRT